MIDFVSAFFSWGKEEIKEPIDPRVVEEKEEIKDYIPDIKNRMKDLIKKKKDVEEDE